MKRKKENAIACQGGGSHTAFTAGVLKKLLQQEIHNSNDLGQYVPPRVCTVCLKRQPDQGSRRYRWLVDFWHTDSTRSTWEKAFNSFSIGASRMIHFLYSRSISYRFYSILLAVDVTRGGIP